jgi:hypothetical protein
MNRRHEITSAIIPGPVAIVDGLRRLLDIFDL